MRFFVRVSPMRVLCRGWFGAVFIYRADVRHWQIRRGLRVPFARFLLVPLWSLREFGTLREAFDELMDMEARESGFAGGEARWL